MWRRMLSKKKNGIRMRKRRTSKRKMAKRRMRLRKENNKGGSGRENERNM
jgi:hypothetical protein